MSGQDYSLPADLLDQAKKELAELSEAIRDGGPTVGLHAVESSLKVYEANTGGSADELLPPDVTELGFVGEERAREFVRKVLCGRKENVAAAVTLTESSGLDTFINELYSLLDFPETAVHVLIAVAAYILSHRLSEICSPSGGLPYEFFY